MTFEQALAAAKKIGLSKVDGVPLLAVTVETLGMVHAVSPKLVFDGAVKKRLSASQVRKLPPVNLGDLMFA